MGKTICRIIGTKKCNATKKLLRYFRERNLEYQFVDLMKEPLSTGELKQIFEKVDPRELIDDQSALYRKRGYAYMEFDPEEELVEYPLLMKTPVVRLGSMVLAEPDSDDLAQLLRDY